MIARVVVGVHDEKVRGERERVDVVSEQRAVMYSSLPYLVVHDVIEVSEIVTESVLPTAPFTHVPFPDEYDRSMNVHPSTHSSARSS